MMTVTTAADSTGARSLAPSQTPRTEPSAAVDDAPRRASGVQSLDRAFALLEIMADAGGEASLSQLADSSGLPLPTIHRIIRTLVGNGYVRQLPSRRYALGPRLIGLGDKASRMLGTWARPHLAQLVEELGETANLAMLDGDKVIYVAQVPSPHAMRMFTEVGRRVLPHSAGVGKALLAQLTDDEALATITRTGMPAATDRTITGPEDFVAELGRIRDRGFAIDDGEQEIGVRCVAVPVEGAPSGMAVSVSGPEARVSWDFVDHAAPIVQQCAESLATDLNNQS
ncbi:IclR family transcriptional regulator [Nocardiopsis coralli]|uniref:IclR family transcriptional regulator n=1 Tax=Nocardiopsis coralli TaxID=2772213 RepID=UPI0022A89E1B|nr:IclR family transcriptional regulator [Nocardiopsis coralli]